MHTTGIRLNIDLKQNFKKNKKEESTRVHSTVIFKSAPSWHEFHNESICLNWIKISVLEFGVWHWKNGSSLSQSDHNILVGPHVFN